MFHSIAIKPEKKRRLEIRIVVRIARVCVRVRHFPTLERRNRKKPAPSIFHLLVFLSNSALVYENMLLRRNDVGFCMLAAHSRLDAVEMARKNKEGAGQEMHTASA